MNVLRARVDPVSGEIYNMTMHVGVEEETLAGERCMEGCHKTSEKQGFEVE